METEKLIPRVQPIQKSARKNKGPKIKKLIEIPSSFVESIPSPKAKEKFVKSPKQDEGKEENQDDLRKQVLHLQSPVDIIMNDLNTLTTRFSMQSPLRSQHFDPDIHTMICTTPILFQCHSTLIKA
ncbi:hypothetical protein GLYMA_20G061900v4 [Glycine max]|nr:hypothetical protein GLYMA_20G061900v4 [Glycine max]KAG4394595.1 hypothetical protein GLYMA_20G061900v4 [Glycine max]KAH1034806.1 hypothetical protein GYH30_054975 [Glycine max]KAH1034809.1 hypothetical protein GYH30_054975 [Glycine max]